MTGFNDRKDAFESKYAHEEKHSFEMEAKCAKIFGLWVANKLGLEGPDAQTYANEVVTANLEKPGLEDMIEKVQKDLEIKGVTISRHLLDVEVEKALVAAQKALSS
jgi:hypothetical protein